MFILYSFHYYRCGNRYTHANRTCPSHPLLKPQRSADLILEPVLSANEEADVEVRRWLEKYRRERQDKTPGKVAPSSTSSGILSNSNASPASVLAPIQATNWSLPTTPAKKTKSIRRGLASELEQENMPHDQQQQRRPLTVANEASGQPENQSQPPPPLRSFPHRFSPLRQPHQSPQRRPAPSTRQVQSPLRQIHSPLRPTPVAKGTPLKYSPFREKILGTPIRPSQSAQRSLLQDQHNSTPISNKKRERQYRSPVNLAATPPSSSSPPSEGSLGGLRSSEGEGCVGGRLVPKKRWLKEIFEQEQQQQQSTPVKRSAADGALAEVLARPITWDDEAAPSSMPMPSTMTLSSPAAANKRPLSPPKSWQVADALVKLRGHINGEEEEQPLNLSMDGPASRA
jgi:hypothetical protein